MTDGTDTPCWRRLALTVLTTGDPQRKCAAALAAETALAAGVKERQSLRPPAQPSRPDRPILLPPQMVAKRRLGTAGGRIALLHAIAHIELNAIDLAFDMALRFASEIDELGLSTEDFVRDWFRVGAEEARHFSILAARLGELGAGYGDLPAHNSLWDAAHATSDRVRARLAIAPLVLEARGLDVTPAMAKRLRLAGDEPSAALLDLIFEEEIGHVGTGTRWFQSVCEAAGLDAADEFPRLVAERFGSGLKGPFNRAARTKAGFPEQFYRNWNETCDAVETGE